MKKFLFYNGTIHTMEEQQAAAVLVEGNRITQIGTEEELRKLTDDQTVFMNLNGRCLVPAFNDTHCHVSMTGLGYHRLELRGVTSVEEIIARGKQYIEDHQLPEGAWIRGENYDHNMFENPVLPDGAVVEAISSRHPIILERVCGHVACANKLGLEMVGFDKNSQFEGGCLDHDAQGELNGIIRESALDQFKMRMPKPSIGEVKEAILAVFAKANACGLGSMQSDDLEAITLPDLIALVKELEDEGRMTVRIWEETQAARPEKLKEILSYGYRTKDGDGFFKMGNIKLILDGSLGARTAYFKKEYADDPGNQGIAVYKQEDLDEMVLLAHKAGMQVAGHAIGDGAAQQMIDACTKAYQEDHVDLRNRIVHCQFVSDEQIQQMKDNHICADVQPPFIPSDVPLVDDRLQERAAAEGYRWKSLLKAGVHIGGGSDSPVETFCPIWGMHCAVNRPAHAGEDAPTWQQEEALTPYEALQIYTSHAAYLSFEENEKGKILPGYLADLVILDQDPLAIEKEKIKEIQVEMTMVNGTIVFQK